MDDGYIDMLSLGRLLQNSSLSWSLAMPDIMFFYVTYMLMLKDGINFLE
jgi:hypothetical protein